MSTDQLLDFGKQLYLRLESRLARIRRIAAVGRWAQPEMLRPVNPAKASIPEFAKVLSIIGMKAVNIRAIRA